MSPGFYTILSSEDLHAKKLCLFRALIAVLNCQLGRKPNGIAHLAEGAGDGDSCDRDSTLPIGKQPYGLKIIFDMRWDAADGKY